MTDVDKQEIIALIEARIAKRMQDAEFQRAGLRRIALAATARLADFAEEARPSRLVETMARTDELMDELRNTEAYIRQLVGIVAELDLLKHAILTGFKIAD